MLRSLIGLSAGGFVAASLCSCGSGNRAVQHAAVATLTLSGIPDQALSTTVAFVSEDLITIGRRPLQTGHPVGTLTAVQWSGGRLLALTSSPVSNYRFGGGLFRLGQGGYFISSLRLPPEVLSRDLVHTAEIPTKFVIPPVDASTVVGDSHVFEGWNVYRMTPTVALIRKGAGELLSLSDGPLVFRVNDEIKIKNIAGELHGSFSVPPRSVCRARALLLTTDRLYLSGCEPGRVVDFAGKTILKMPEPDGWGFRFGLSADGHRILFDNFTRRISALQRVVESVESVLTLGNGPVVTSRGEIIRVADTQTGKICLDLDTPDSQLGPPGGYHADISPSGRFIAVAGGNIVSVYSLPATCSE
jgi:hypothetical protein